MMPTLDDGTYRLPYHGYGEFEEVWITSSSGREMVRVLKMSNEDFLKAAADRAQVGSSAEVAQKAKRDVITIRETMRVAPHRNAVVVEFIDDRIYVSLECKDHDLHHALMDMAMTNPGS